MTDTPDLAQQYEAHLDLYVRVTDPATAPHDALRAYRVILGEKSETVAQVFGVTRPTWSCWENGRFPVKPHIVYMLQIAAFAKLHDDRRCFVGGQPPIWANLKRFALPHDHPSLSTEPDSCPMHPER